MGGLFFDPSMRPAIDHLIDNGQVSENFRGMPHEWGTPTTNRALILMTDGRNNCSSPRIDCPGGDSLDARTVDTCNALRAEGIVIYGVAFRGPDPRRGVDAKMRLLAEPLFQRIRGAALRGVPIHRNEYPLWLATIDPLSAALKSAARRL